jgi:hypothetical protein
VEAVSAFCDFRVLHPRGVFGTEFSSAMFGCNGIGRQQDNEPALVLAVCSFLKDHDIAEVVRRHERALVCAALAVHACAAFTSF